MIVHLTPWPPLLAGLAVFIGMCVVPPMFGGVTELEVGGHRVAWGSQGFSYRNQNYPEYVTLDVRTDHSHARYVEARTYQMGVSGFWPWSRSYDGTNGLLRDRGNVTLRVDSRGFIYNEKTNLACHGNVCMHPMPMSVEEYLRRFPNGPVYKTTEEVR